MENLNSRQKEAVTTVEGPVLVIAGPGSGKTKVLTHRIAYLIAHKKINPQNILAVTFTNKAAGEMKERVEFLLSKSALLSDFSRNDGSSRSAGSDSQFSLKAGRASVSSIQEVNFQFPTIGTFHSVCVRILRQEAQLVGYKRDFVIYDDDDQLSLVKKIMQELHINTDQFNPSAVLSHICGAKNELIDPESYSNIAEGYFQETVSRIYSAYQSRLKENNAFDFDDLIMQTVALFSNNSEILEKYQQRFKYIMVDEYQDTNYAQYKLIDFLSQSHRNLCVVGDDWQSIYRWRGADIRNILEFEKNYPDAKVILLEQNYRSTQTILDGASSIISKNVNRKEKRLWTEKTSDYPIVICEADNERGEAQFIVSKIRELINREEVKPSDVAVLYRTNAQSRAVEEVFLRCGVPYKIVGGVRFYMRKEIKDVIAYFRFIQNQSDLASLERIINTPSRGIGKTTFEKIARETKKSKKDATWVILNYKSGDITKDKLKKLKEFALVIKDCQKKCPQMKMSEFLDYLIKKIGYEQYIRDGSEEGERRWENVKELFSAIEKYNELSSEDGLRLFLEEVALSTDLDQIDDNQNSVTLMTLHSAKGLEFDTVFIIGLEEGLLPHSKSIGDPLEMEEERRLCYVGITRAKNRVYLSFARLRKIYGSIQANRPSRFLFDIPEHLVERESQECGFSEEWYEEEYVEID